VNVHYFVDDDCEGKTAAKISWQQYDQWDAFYRADHLIKNANTYLEDISYNPQWNQLELNATVTDTQCVMIRLVLDEVYIHCNTSAKMVQWNRVTETENNFFRNRDNSYAEGLNIFITEVTNGSADDAVNGFAPFGGEYSVVENFGSKLLAHEIGHNLRLLHTFEGWLPSNDGCLDTPETAWVYDRNNDGVADLTGAYCFNTYNTFDFDPQFCEPGGVNAINVHPCCEDEHQDNNVMTYSVHSEKGYLAAMTPCQVDKMLDNLLTRKCDYIAAINPICPPVSAFIGVPANEEVSNKHKFKLNFWASTNETSYRVIYEIKEDDGTFSTYAIQDWKDGTAKSVTIGVTDQGTVIKNVDILLKCNSTFNIILETRNACGTDHHAIRLITPICDPPQAPGGIFNFADIYPSPFQQNTQLAYDIKEAAMVDIFYYSLGNGGTGGQPIFKAADSGYKAAGEHTVNFTDAEMGQGLNYIIIYAGGVSYVKRAIKY
jgi:hypothetical protein